MSSVFKNKRGSILSIAAKHGAKDIRIFGSFARGEDKPGSDADFIVDLEEGRSLFDLIALRNNLEKLLGRKVDVVTEGSIHWYIKNKIIQEAAEI